MKINRKIDNDFETAFCEILSDCGYWVHNFALNTSRGDYMITLPVLEQLSKFKRTLNLKDTIENALALEDWL